MCAMMTRNQEEGIIIMEDLTKGKDPYFILDKKLIPSIDHVILIIKTAAHFHGVWWKRLNNVEGMDRKKM